ncbi:hypothetical protein Pogu_1669 [Pyrobaculum oguniense TE7]|uniref:Uncharacterized protein n=1 Tax=Pyrobaculum oguniense (strain DSM 13380 / JCM 10595 / TE7) TaxID=698757 RepID=H6QAS0_PYROT|nr:hypothetical protein Pogu_1669 [Pyrobaculum oguniense TE7]
MGDKFRKRLHACYQLLWLKRLYLAYGLLLLLVYTVERLWPSSPAAQLKFVVLANWFVPLLAASVIARRKVLGLRNEAALALMEFVHRRGYFCTAAGLAAMSVALLAVTWLAAVLLSGFLRLDYPAMYIVATALFVTAFDYYVDRELKRLRQDLELVEKLKTSYEKVKNLTYT